MISPVVLVVTSSVLVVAVTIISGVVCGVFLCCVVGVVGGGVMIVSGGQVDPLTLKVTSARCTQLEVEGRLSTKVSTGRRELTVRDMHTLTRESQEVVVGEILVTKLLLPDIEEAIKRLIILTDILHSGQLNITTSTLPTPV